MPISYVNAKEQEYFLHKALVTLRSRHQQVIYYFAREIGSRAVTEMPTGFEIVENKRSGLPVLRKV
jgi:hypothetical protein